MLEAIPMNIPLSSLAHVIRSKNAGPAQLMKLSPIGAMAEPSEADLLGCRHIVGQCGSETLARALATQPDVLIAGIADTAELARTAAGVFKQNLLHHAYPGRVSTAGNLAFAFTPSELDAREAYRFVLYHVLRDAPLQDLFAVETLEVGGAATIH